MDEKKQAITDFEEMGNLAELNALSNLSLEQPITEKQYRRIIELKKIVLKWYKTANIT